MAGFLPFLHFGCCFFASIFVVLLFCLFAFFSHFLYIYVWDSPTMEMLGYGYGRNPIPINSPRFLSPSTNICNVHTTLKITCHFLSWHYCPSVKTKQLRSLKIELPCLPPKSMLALVAPCFDKTTTLQHDNNQVQKIAFMCFVIKP